MAAAGTYYIDTINFADANEVFLDAALTTCAPNGFYQMGGATARQQVDCVNGVGGRLLDPVACPSCTPPAVDPPIAANTSYKVTDVVTSAIAFVAITNTYQPTQKITTNLSTNCWLINNGSTDAITATITGPCNVQPVEQPLYFLLNPCPNSVPPSSEYTFTYIVDPSNNKPPANGRYLDPTTGQFYTSANTTNPIGSAIPLSGSNNLYNSVVNNNLTLVGSFPSDPVNLGCPPPPEVFCYWNATPCSGGAQVIIKTPANVFDSIAQGTSSVKVSGTCYTINDISLCTSDVVANIGLYDGTIYTACQLGTNPCIPAVVATPSFDVVETTSGAANLVTKRNGFSQNDNIVITGLAGCWKLVSPSTVSTSNTIQDFCPTVTVCAEYEVGGNYSYVECYSGITQTGSIGGDSFPACARLDSATSDAAGLPEFISVCFDDIAPPNPFNYYTAVACLYPNSTPIIARNNGSVIQTGRSIKVSGSSTCYLITGLSNNQSNYSDIVNEYQDCAECNPPAACFEFSVDSNTSNTKCPENNPTTVYGNTADFTTASKLYINQLACQNGQAATVGTYAQAVNNNQRVSRYWDGNNLFSPLTCDPVDVFVTATINNIQNDIKGSDVNVGYTITGSGIGSQTTGVSPLLIPSGGSAPFNTGVSVNSGYNITTPIVVSYDTASITQDSNVGVTLTGEINLIPTVNYSVRTCGTQVIYSVDKGSTQAVNFDIIFFITDSGQQLCGEVTSTTSTPSSARALYIITQDGCDNSFCTGSTGGKPAF